MTDTAYGLQQPSTESSDYNALLFVIAQELLKMQTATLVKVVACTNSGGLSTAGTVDVQPLINQMTGDRKAVPHGVVYGLPYLRVQGGANAVIMDPTPGDIGICVFANRDISAVVAKKGQANPGSLRIFDWSDGLYLGGVLNGTPTQYIQFEGGNVTIASTGTVTINASAIDLNGVLTINSKPFLSHDHTGVQTGGGTSGPVGP